MDGTVAQNKSLFKCSIGSWWRTDRCPEAEEAALAPG